MMTIDDALERLNHKLNLLAAAGGIAAAVAPGKILPFMYAHWVAVCFYLFVGVAPIQELFHPRMAWEQMRTDRLGFVWFAKFATLWILVLLSSFLLISHQSEPASDRAQAVPDYQRLACENGPTDPECKNHTSVIEIRGGETLKYITPSNLPRSQKPGELSVDKGLVRILYLGHNQEFFLSCGVFGEQGTPVMVKDSTVTCP